ncbi:MAG: serine hydrolase [Planctomycetota bacterium]|nr:serine hydrolase [Planctomycetota bacterium]
MQHLSVQFAYERISVRSLLLIAISLTGISLPGLVATSIAAEPRAAQDVAAEQSPESVGMSTKRLSRLDRNLAGYVERGEVAGVVALIARRGKVVYHRSFGQRYIEAEAAMTRDTIFRIASMTKPIVSVALMQLWERGRFQLRDPISKFLPEFAEMKVAVAPADGEYLGQPYKLVEAARPISFQHLLTHTAGLPNSYRGLTRPLYQELGSKRRPDWTVGDYVTELSKLPLNFHPGDRWEYGPATNVVGRLVEVMSGQPLDDYLDEHIFRPLEMVDTHFYLPEKKLARFAANYRPDENGKIVLTEAPTADSRHVREPHKFFSGSGGLVSTSRDYFHFHQMMLNGGELDGARVLGPRTVRLITANHIGDKEIWLRGPGYGFGLGYSVVTDLGQSAMPASAGTYSWGGAFCTVFWVDPREELLGILMTQVRPYRHLNIRQDFQTITYQAILE